MGTLAQRSFRRKPVEVTAQETGVDHAGGELARSVGLFQLAMIGIGATVGTGIFFVDVVHRGDAGQGRVRQRRRAPAA